MPGMEKKGRSMIANYKKGGKVLKKVKQITKKDSMGNITNVKANMFHQVF